MTTHLCVTAQNRDLIDVSNSPIPPRQDLQVVCHDRDTGSLVSGRFKPRVDPRCRQRG